MLISGLANGALYFLVLLGALLIYRVSGAVNFAQGQFGMVAAFGSYWLYEFHGVAPALAIVIGIVAAAVISIATDALLVQRVPEGGGRDLLLTLGVLLVLTAAAERIVGSQSYQYLPLLNDEAITVLGTRINANDILLIVLASAALAATLLALERTRYGVMVRGTAERPAVASSVGIDVPALRLAIWGIAGAIAGVAGVLTASRGSVSAYFMTAILIKAFVCGIVGGLDRLVAPFAVAMAFGVVESVVVYAFGAQTQDVTIFVLAVLALSLAPRHFLEERHEARA